MRGKEIQWSKDILKKKKNGVRKIEHTDAKRK